MPRWLRLAGAGPLPAFFDIDDTMPPRSDAAATPVIRVATSGWRSSRAAVRPCPPELSVRRRGRRRMTRPVVVVASRWSCWRGCLAAAATSAAPRADHGAAPTPRPTPSPTPSPTPTTDAEAGAAGRRNPLTGLARCADRTGRRGQDRRHRERPARRSGSSRADIVYVEQVEGGLTRLAGGLRQPAARRGRPGPQRAAPPTPSCCASTARSRSAYSGGAAGHAAGAAAPLAGVDAGPQRAGGAYRRPRAVGPRRTTYAWPTRRSRTRRPTPPGGPRTSGFAGRPPTPARRRRRGCTRVSVPTSADRGAVHAGPADEDATAWLQVRLRRLDRRTGRAVIAHDRT